MIECSKYLCRTKFKSHWGNAIKTFEEIERNLRGKENGFPTFGRCCNTVPFLLCFLFCCCKPAPIDIFFFLFSHFISEIIQDEENGPFESGAMTLWLVAVMEKHVNLSVGRGSAVTDGKGAIQLKGPNWVKDDFYSKNRNIFSMW